MREVAGVERVMAIELPEHVGVRVTIAGWVHHR